MNYFRMPLLAFFLLATLFTSQSARAISTYDLIGKGDQALHNHIKGAVTAEAKICSSKDDMRKIALWYVKEGGADQIYDAIEQDFKDAVAKKEKGEDFSKAFRDLEKDILPALMPVNCRKSQ